MPFRSLLCFTIVAAVAAPATAADVAFPGPAGWKHVDPPASTDATRKSDQWHIPGDVATVTFIADTSNAYGDALGAIEQNFKSNGIKPATDKDMPCQGKTGHMVEFSTGPDGHKIIINRLLVPSGAGVVTITYARADGTAFDTDVKASETTYCAAPAS
jgi:hypothetical protein